MKRGWVRVLLLYIFSFGLYGIYWFYVTRRDVFKEMGASDKSPFLHTLGQFVPILNIFIHYWLVKDIAELSAKAKAKEVQTPLIIVLWIFFNPAGIVLTQVAWNDYWDKRLKGKAQDVPLRFVEFIPVILAALIGLALVALFVAAIIFATVTERPANDANRHIAVANGLVQRATASTTPDTAAVEQSQRETQQAELDLQRYRSKAFRSHTYADILQREIVTLRSYQAEYLNAYSDGQLSGDESLRLQAALTALDRADRKRHNYNTSQSSSSFADGDY